MELKFNLITFLDENQFYVTGTFTFSMIYAIAIFVFKEFNGLRSSTFKIYKVSDVTALAELKEALPAQVQNCLCILMYFCIKSVAMQRK